jgi:hypothetical protein
MGVIQIRGISDAAHRRLKEMAAEQGVSLSEFLREELEETARQMTLAEWTEWVRAREPVAGLSGAELVRDAREEREGELEARARGRWRDDRR